MKISVLRHKTEARSDMLANAYDVIADAIV